MNILFFITPKSEVAYIYDDYSLRQTIEKMEYHKYTAVPLLNRQGIYIGTITEGDLLRTVKEQYDLNLHDAEDMPIYKVKRRWKIDPVTIDCDIEDLISLAMRQNFVPVVDDKGVFIGIIPRKTIIQYFYEKSGEGSGEKAGSPSKKCSPSAGM
jgi:CBS domain-containing protein